MAISLRSPVPLDNNDSRQKWSDGRHLGAQGVHPIREPRHLGANGPEMLKHEVVRLNHHPPPPSSEMPISFCVSAMNSIGSCWSTSRTKPLTISAVASSALMPRWTQ